MDRAFQVDLRGVVGLLSHHLYTSPRVYVRELLQNAVDAISARRLAEPDAERTVSIEPRESTGDEPGAAVGMDLLQVQILLEGERPDPAEPILARAHEACEEDDPRRTTIANLLAGLQSGPDRH